MPSKYKSSVKKRKLSRVRVPDLGKDVAFLLCAAAPPPLDGHQGLTDGDYSIQIFGNSKGFKKLGKYFLALAESDTSNDGGFHHHFCQVRSLTKTKIELTVRKNKSADIDGML